MKLREGIIVKSQKYQENSKIITLVNEEGLTTLLVRGASNIKSRNFSYSNELTKIGYDISNKGTNSFHILTTGTIINNYSTIKTDFNRLNDALTILEAINHLGTHIEDFKLFYQFTDQILENINNEYSPYYLTVFRLKLLYLLGIGPIFSKCTACEGKDNLIGFDLLSGGMKCINCIEKDDVIYKKEVIEIVKFLYLTKLEFLTPDVLNKVPKLSLEVNQFLDQYYSHYLGYNSIVDKVIKKMKMN